MNEAKKIKKFLRNKENRVVVHLVESDAWGADESLGVFMTFGTLQQEASKWRVRFEEKYGYGPDTVMDAPYLSYLVFIEGSDGKALYSKSFRNLIDLKKFLIGGFDGFQFDGE